MFRKIILTIVLTLVCSTMTLAAPATAEPQLSTSGYLKKSDGGKGLQISTTYCPFGSLNCKKGEYVSGVSGVTSFSLRLLGGLLNFAAIVAVIFLIIGGARLVLAGGSSEGLGAAKKHLLWTVGGLVVVIISMIIVRNLTDVIYESTDISLQGEKDGRRVLPLPEASTEIPPDVATTAETLSCPDGSAINIVEGFVATQSGKFNAKTDVDPFKAKFTTALTKAEGLARDGGIGGEFANNKVVAAILTDMVYNGEDAGAFIAGVKQAITGSAEEQNRAWGALANAASKPAYKEILGQLATPNGAAAANQALISKAKGSSSFLCATAAPTAAKIPEGPCKLINVSELGLANIGDAKECNSNPDPKDKACKIDADFQPVMSQINAVAANLGIKVMITSGYRKDANVSGAAVQPAKGSNHMTGHAIDFRLIKGKEICDRSCLWAKNRPTWVQSFIDGVKKSGLRWGGGFSTYDPIHFDDGMNLSNGAAWKAKFEDLQANCQAK